MLDFREDMRTVFFGSDFASTFSRQRASVPDVDVVGILGIADDEALDGKVIAAARVLRMPTDLDVRADDVLIVRQAIPDLGVAIGARFKVLEKPKRVNDGAEMEALLGSVSA